MKKGFTLIELLVVIAIIAILAAILFPVFAQAREKARATQCLSNCKQLGTATNLYIDDYDETYPLVMAPPSGRDNDSTYSAYPIQNFNGNTSGFGGCPALYPYSLTGSYWTWMDCIYPYVKNLNMYTCPSAKKGANGYGMNPNIHNMVGGTTSAQSSYGSGYGYVTDDWQNYAQGKTSTISTRSASGIKATASLVLYSDTYVFGGSPAYGFVVSWPYLISKDRGTSYKVSGSNPGNRHNEGANFCFADGHAKFYKATGNTAGEDPFAYANGENRGTTSPWWNPDFQ